MERPHAKDLGMTELLCYKQQQHQQQRILEIIPCPSWYDKLTQQFNITEMRYGMNE